jgi:hypothetical protein
MSHVNVRDAIDGVYEQIEKICRSEEGSKPGPQLADFLMSSIQPLLPKGIEFDFIVTQSEVQHIFFEKANPQNAIIL